MDNDYAFINETNIVLDHMFYILGFILKNVYGQQMKYTSFMVFTFLERYIQTLMSACFSCLAAK